MLKFFCLLSVLLERFFMSWPILVSTLSSFQLVSYCTVVYAKHDKHFYSLLDQLTLEYEGKGNFWSEGHRLGGRISKPHTNHEKRSLLAQAAEKRRNRSLLLGASQKLGGSSPDSTATPQQMAALAAIRRLEDNKWCGTLELLDQ